jgi:hypothetical protein
VVLGSLQLPFIEDARATVCVLDASTDRFSSAAECTGRIAVLVKQWPDGAGGAGRALDSARYGKPLRTTHTVTTGAAR